MALAASALLSLLSFVSASTWDFSFDFADFDFEIFGVCRLVARAVRRGACSVEEVEADSTAAGAGAGLGTKAGPRPAQRHKPSALRNCTYEEMA